MKKVLAAIMSLIIVLAVGTSCTNKKAEDEYKAKVKEELDAIPVEATGYEFALRTKEEWGWSKNEIIVPYVEYQDNLYSKKIGNHLYNIKIFYEEDDDVEGWASDRWGMDVSVDDGEIKRVKFNYKDEYKNFQDVERIVSFDDQIFVIRGRIGSHKKFYWEYFPPTLFLYDYEINELKYLGYSKDWFDNRVFLFNCEYLKIVKK